MFNKDFEDKNFLKKREKRQSTLSPSDNILYSLSPQERVIFSEWIRSYNRQSTEAQRSIINSNGNTNI